MRILTENERTTLTTALFAAAEEYDKIVRLSSAELNPGEKRLAEQFERQAKEARELSALIENADEIAIR